MEVDPGGRPAAASTARWVSPRIPWVLTRSRAASSSSVRRSVIEAQSTGRFSKGVDSTIVVRVDTLAAPRMRASSSSSASGVATRILRM